MESLGKAESSLAGITEIRNNLQKQVNELAGSRTELQQKVEELAGSRTELQQKVEQLARAQENLQKRVDALSSSRNVALTEAKKAQAKIDNLTNQMQAQVQQAKDLKEQIRSVRAVLEQFQNRPQ
jgi:chromosome segregation ATPase